MAKYLIETDGGKYEVETEDSSMQPALDVAGTAIGVGGQAVRGLSEANRSMGAFSPAPQAGLDLAGKVIGAVGKGYNFIKDKYLESPLNINKDIASKVLSKDPIIQGDMPIKELHGGKLETMGNIPVSESPQSIFKHLQSLGIDTALLGGVGSKVEQFNDPANMLTRASKAQSKAENILAEVLQPKTGEMEDVIKYTLPEITKTKDYGKLTSLLEDARDSTGREAQQLLASSKAQVGEEYLEPLLDLYKTMSKEPQMADKADTLAKAINKEYEYLFSKKGRKISVMEAQQRKETLQTLTKSILESGGADISDPVLKQGLDRIRFGFRKSMEEAVPGLKEKNAPYGGRKEAAELAKVQRDLALKEGPHNPIKDLLAHVFRGSKAQTGAAIAREAFRKEASLGSKTAKIEKLRNKATTLRELAGKRIRGEK